MKTDVVVDSVKTKLDNLNANIGSIKLDLGSLTAHTAALKNDFGSMRNEFQLFRGEMEIRIDRIESLTNQTRGDVEPAGRFQRVEGSAQRINHVRPKHLRVPG